MLGTARLALAAALGLVLTAGAAGTPVQARVAGTPATAAGPAVTTVIAVSIDGLNPAALRRLGPGRAPTLHRLVDEGAATMNARTAREQTSTLPNHTGMVTGRRIAAARGGHGVVWNDDRRRPRTVQRAAGERVGSVFSVVDQADESAGLFVSKGKLSLFSRSWGSGVDHYRLREDNARLVRRVGADLAATPRAFRLVHLSRPDVAGHAHGFMSLPYLRAVATTDELLGRIVAAVEGDDDLAGHTVLIVTSDHGGRGASHRDPSRLADYRVPFIVWGPGVATGADLYDLNPDYADPGRERTAYDDARQPVRNAAVANLATDLLGLGAVPGSEHNAAQDLDVR